MGNTVAFREVVALQDGARQHSPQFDLRYGVP